MQTCMQPHFLRVYAETRSYMKIRVYHTSWREHADLHAAPFSTDRWAGTEDVLPPSPPSMCGPFPRIDEPELRTPYREEPIEPEEDGRAGKDTRVIQNEN